MDQQQIAEPDLERNLQSFKERIAGQQPLLADGAMGTMLHALGAGRNACFDELNLVDPQLVEQVHLAYVQAGAQVLETNSFGANRFKLASHGLEDQVAEINFAAVRIARAAASQVVGQIYVAGSVGPLGVRLKPYGRVPETLARKAFEDQIGALVEAGIDVVFIETQSSVQEALLAVAAAKVFDGLPIMVSLSFSRANRTLMGDSPADAARAFAEQGVDLIGANCSSGPAQLLRILQTMRQAAPEARLSVMPNAGWPTSVGGRVLYPDNADYFADYAQAYRQAGASLIGGCCGTTPDHIRAMRNALDTPDEPSALLRSIPAIQSAAETHMPMAEPTGLGRKLAAGKFVTAVELDPPRGASMEKMLAAAHTLQQAGVDVINVADSPMAHMRMSPWAVCHSIQDQLEQETVLHFPTRGRSLLRIQGDLLAAHALGVRNIFVVMGDPTAIGDYPQAMDQYDVVPSGLIRLIKQKFNAGLDHAGTDIDAATSFMVGCALNLGAPDLEREMRVLLRKIEAGADFALTQPIYEPEILETFLELFHRRHGALDLPILAGLLPLYNARHARFLQHEVPGIDIPGEMHARIANAGSQSMAEGVQMTLDLLNQIQDLAQGVYIMPPFNRYDMAAQILESNDLQG